MTDSNTIANTDLAFGDNSFAIASALVGKTVRYLNLGESTVVPSGLRYFKINTIEDISVSKKTGRRYVRASVTDLDDKGETKFRCLHLGGISHIA